MNEESALKLLNDVGAVIENDHFVYTSGKHGSAYVNKDAIYPHPRVVSKLCAEIAKMFLEYAVDTVIAPAVGGVILSQWVAFHLDRLSGYPVYSVYADKTDDGGFVIKRGYDKYITGKRVLVIEDTLNTGKSAKKVTELVRELDGFVIGMGVLCNRGGIKLEDVAYPPKLFALTNITLEVWDAKDCPLCKAGVPINTAVGKGLEFIRARESQ